MTQGDLLQVSNSHKICKCLNKSLQIENLILNKTCWPKFTSWDFLSLHLNSISGLGLNLINFELSQKKVFKILKSNLHWWPAQNRVSQDQTLIYRPNQRARFSCQRFSLFDLSIISKSLHWSASVMVYGFLLDIIEKYLIHEWTLSIYTLRPRALLFIHSSTAYSLFLFITELVIIS